MKQEMENSSKASDAMKSGQHGATVEPGEGGDPKNGSLEANDSNAVQKTKEENDRTRIKEATDSPKAKDNLADPGGADPVSKSDEKSKDVEVGSGDETEGAPAASLDEKSQANATDKPNSDKVSAKGYSEAMEERKDEAAADGASLEKNDAGKEQTNGPADNNSDDDPFAGLDDVASMDIYDLSNYTFGKKNQESKSRVMQLIPKAEMTKILEKKYEERGMRRSVGGVILVHAHNFPHILLLQRSDGKGEYALPGGRLRPGESDEEGLQRKLNTKLKPEGQKGAEDDQELDIGERSTIPFSFTHTKAFIFDTVSLASHQLGLPSLTTNSFLRVILSSLYSLQLVRHRFSQEILPLCPSTCNKSQGRTSCL